jgi:hypothetical protein
LVLREFLTDPSLGLGYEAQLIGDTIYTPEQVEMLSSRKVAPRWLVEIEFDGGTTRLWNGLGILRALGEDWIGAGRLGTIEPIQDTQATVASGVRMSLTIVPTDEMPDAPDAFLNIALSEQYQGRPCTIYGALMNPDTNELIGDPFIRFNGNLDVMEDVEIPGQAVVTVTAENRLIDLERPKNRNYTPEDQKSFFPGDTFFDEVAQLQQREIVLRE